MSKSFSVSSAIKPRRIPFVFYFLISGLLMMVLSVSAYADTYNFFFDKKKKGEQTQSDQTGDTEETEAPKAQENPPPAVNPPTTQTITSPPGSAPIVINNTVNVPNTLQPSPAPEIVAPPPPPAPVETVVAQQNRADEYKCPKWRFGLSGGAFSLMGVSGIATLSTDYSVSSYTSSASADASPYLLVTFGHRFAPFFGVNLAVGPYVSGTFNSRAVLLADAELVPLRLNVKNFDLFEVGGILGVSNFSSGSSYAHVGVRVNVNLGPNVSLTSALRGNRNLTMFDLGFTVNI